MALDFPNSPTDGQVYTDAATGEQWVYESATNSWTSKGLVNTSGGTSYKGSLDITAAPPAGVQSGWMYSALATGTADAGFGPGLTGTVTKGDLILFTGTEWTDTSHSVPDATAVVKGIDKKLWKRSGTTLSPETAGDAVDIDFPLGTAALPGLTPVGDSNTGVWAPAADTLAISTKGTERLRTTDDGYVRLASGTGGIQFNGDTAAANALDDYEEGTFTPALNFGSAATGITYALQRGAYTKVGNVVRFVVDIELTSKGSATGNATISGLPFSISNTNGTSFATGMSTITTDSKGDLLMLLASGTVSQLRGQNSNSNYSDTAFGATTIIRITGTYQAT